MIIPKSIELSINRGCNLRCYMCQIDPSGGNMHPVWHMPFEHFVSAFEPHVDLLKNTVVRMQSNGGEPTIHPQFAEMVRFLLPYVRRVYFTTNGSMLHKLPDNVYTPQTYVEVSIDGAAKATYEQIRSGADWDALWQGIRKAQRRDALLACNCVLLEQNAGEVLDLVDMVADLGFVQFNLGHQFASWDNKRYNPKVKEALTLLGHIRKKCNDRQIEFSDRVTRQLGLPSLCHTKLEGYSDGSYFCPYLWTVATHLRAGYLICRRLGSEDSHVLDKWVLGEPPEAILTCFNERESINEVRRQHLSGNLCQQCTRCVEGAKYSDFYQFRRGPNPYAGHFERLEYETEAGFKAWWTSKTKGATAESVNGEGWRWHEEVENTLAHLLEVYCAGGTAAIDYGTGSGRLLPFLARHFDMIYAVDCCEERLSMAQALLNRLRPDLSRQVSFHGVSVSGTGMPEWSADAVLLHKVIMHLPDHLARSVFEALRARTQPNAVFILGETNYPMEAGPRRAKDRFYVYNRRVGEIEDLSGLTALAAVPCRPWGSYIVMRKRDGSV